MSKKVIAIAASLALAMTSLGLLAQSALAWGSYNNSYMNMNMHYMPTMSYHTSYYYPCPPPYHMSYGMSYNNNWGMNWNWGGHW